MARGCLVIGGACIGMALAHGLTRYMLFQEVSSPAIVVGLLIGAANIWIGHRGAQ